MQPWESRLMGVGSGTGSPPYRGPTANGWLSLGEVAFVLEKARKWGERARCSC